jgi:hypothetical protein
MQLPPQYIHPVERTVALRPQRPFAELIAIEGIDDYPISHGSPDPSLRGARILARRRNSGGRRGAGRRISISKDFRTNVLLSDI